MILASRQLVRITVAARRLLKEITHLTTSDLTLGAEMTIDMIG
jgi:hypothetical protein